MEKLLILENLIDVEVVEDTKFYVVFPDKTSTVKRELNLFFKTPGVTAEIIVLYKLHQNENIDLAVSTNHLTTNTSCITKVKAVLQDKCVSTFNGKILIAKGANGTDAYLQDDVLVLNEGPINNSSPILEIDANDVKASHGATTGMVSKDMLYYLMSRGLELQEATDLIVEGFFESEISKILDDTIKTAVSKEVL